MACDCMFPQLHDLQIYLPARSHDVGGSDRVIHSGWDMKFPLHDSSEVPKHPLAKKFDIPDNISAEEVIDFFRKSLSDFELFGVMPAVDLENKTVIFTESFTAHGYYMQMPLKKNTESCFPFSKNREKRLKDAWRFVQSRLLGIGIFSTLNLDDSYMELVASPSQISKDLIDRAKILLQLLTITSVPSFMALEIFDSSREHVLVSLHEYKSPNKEKYLERWECLFDKLMDLSKETRCHLFLNEDTFTAVTTEGSSREELDELLARVRLIFVSNLCPVKRSVGRSIDGSDDPHSKLEAFSLYASIQGKQEKLKKSLLMVERSLFDYMVDYNLDLPNQSMACASMRSSNHPDAINSIGLFFELLSRTHVPASMATEVLDGCLQGYLIKIGSQPGGLCYKHKINNEDYVKRWNCLHYSLEALAKAAGSCNMFLDENTVAVLCDSSYGLRLVELFVEACIVHNVCPGNTARIIHVLRYGWESMDDPHVNHMKMETSGSLPVGLIKAASFHTLLHDEQAPGLIKNLNLESFWKLNGVSCNWIEVDSSMLVSVRTEDDNVIDRTWDVIRLLSANVPLPRVIAAVDGKLHYSVIRTKFSPRVLDYKYGHTMGYFVRIVRPRYESFLKDLEKEEECTIVNNEESLAVFGSKADGIETVRRIILDGLALRHGGFTKRRSKRRCVAG